MKRLSEVLKTIEYSDQIVWIDEDMLLRIQNRLLEMLKDFSKVCEENGIKWSLSAGSILGAVRHKGFIPWDEDADIFMERDQFEKLRDVFDKSMSDKYVLRLPGDRDYLYHFPQIQDKKFKIKEMQSKGDGLEGLFIDIFILENTYENPVLRTIHGVKCTLYLMALSSMRMDLCKENLLKYCNNNKMVRRAVALRASFSFLFCFWPFEKWVILADKCFSSVKEKSKYVVVPSGGKHFFGEIYSRKKMCNQVKCSFSGEELYIPEGYQYYLEKRYGKDYMVVPKETDRERHAYAAIEPG